MGRLKTANIVSVTTETGQYTNVPAHNFTVRRSTTHPTYVDTVMDDTTKNAVLNGSLDSAGSGLDVFKWKKKQVYGYVVGIFQKLELLPLLGITEDQFLAFVIDIDRGYFDNPYHNFYHCVDVFHIVYYFLTFLDAGKWMNKLDITAILLAALCHDVAHPGVNNLYQVHARTKLAVMYNDISVLENYSCSMTFNLATKHGLFRNLDRNDFRNLRATVIQGILATDMSCHFELLEKFKNFVKNYNDEQVLTIDNKRLILNVILHAADISNPSRPWELCKKWSDYVVEEFFLQGDLEKLNSLPISPNMDRGTTNQPSISTGFIDYLVKPFFDAISVLLPKTSVFLEQLTENRKKWQELKEEAEKREKDGSLLSVTSSGIIITNGSRRLSVPSGTVTLPEDLFLKLSNDSESREHSPHSHSKSYSSIGSKENLATVQEGPSEQEVPRKASLASKTEDSRAPENKKDRSLNSLKAKKRPSRNFESDKEYFHSLLSRTLHLSSDDMAVIQAKKSGSKSSQKSLNKAFALLELSTLFLEVEKDVELTGVGSLLAEMFPTIAEFIGRVLNAFYCRIYLVDQTKRGKGVVLFSKGGFEMGTDASEAAMNVEASNTSFGDVVRQRQLSLVHNNGNNSKDTNNSFTIIFPLITDAPASQEGDVVGIIEIKRTSRNFENDDIKLLDNLSQVLTPKFLISYQLEEERKMGDN